MTNALFFPSWTVTSIEIDDDGAYQIAAHPTEPPTLCVDCGVRGEHIPIEQKQIRYVDAPVHGRQTFITATRTRYKCAACRLTLWEFLSGIDDRKFKTHRCVEYIKEQSLLKLNTHVAEEVGVDESTVRRIGDKHAAELNAQHKRDLRAPRYIGMDETKLVGSMRAVFVNLDDSWPFEMLANNNDLTITNFYMNLPGRKSVVAVTMDMTDRYRAIVKAVMPQAAIIADRWHVIKTANEAMTAARVKYQKTLPKKAYLAVLRSRGLFQKRYDEIKAEKLLFDGMLKNHEALREPYWIKERFLSIWDRPDRESAKVALDDWRASIPDHLRKLFKKSIDASNRWEKEILNFFDHGGKSNGIVERRNSDYKAIERLGANMGFEKIRNRALFGKRPKRVREEYAAKWQAWRESNPTCIVCKKPFDEASEEAWAKSSRGRLTPPPRTIGYVQCRPCIEEENATWEETWTADAHLYRDREPMAPTSG